MPGIVIEIDTSGAVSNLDKLRNSLQDSGNQGAILADKLVSFRKALEASGATAKLTDDELASLADRFRDRLHADAAASALQTTSQMIQQIGVAAGLSASEIAKLHQQMGTLATNSNTANRSLSSNAQNTASFSSQLTSFATSLGLAALAYKAFKEVVSATYNFTKESVLDAARYQTLGVSIDKLGQNAGYTSAEMHQIDESVQKTGISMLSSREAIAKMVTAELDLSKASQLAAAAQGIATTNGKNSSDVFEKLIQGITTGQTVLLHHQGIMINLKDVYDQYAQKMGYVSGDALPEAEKRQAAYNAVLEYAQRYLGVYSDAMQTAGKQITSFQRYMDDLKTTVGQPFLDAFTKSVFSAADSLAKLKEIMSTPEAMQAMNSLATSIGNVVNIIIQNIPPAIQILIKLKSTLDGLHDSNAANIAEAQSAVYQNKVKELQELKKNNQSGGISLDGLDQGVNDAIIKQKEKELQDYITKQMQSHYTSNNVGNHLSSNDVDTSSADAIAQKNKAQKGYAETTAVTSQTLKELNEYETTANKIAALREAHDIKEIQLRNALNAAMQAGDKGEVNKTQHALELNDSALKKRIDDLNKKDKKGASAADAAARYTEGANSFYNSVAASIEQLQDSFTGKNESNSLRVDKWFEQQFDNIRQKVIGAKGDVSSLARAWVLLTQAEPGVKQLATLKDETTELRNQSQILSDIGQATGDPALTARSAVLSADAWKKEKTQIVQGSNLDDETKQNLLLQIEQGYNAKIVKGKADAYQNMKAVSKQYWDSEKDLVQQNLDTVKSASSDETHYKIYEAEQWDSYFKSLLENEANYSGNFSSILKAKMSLAFGGYKSELTQSNDDYKAYADGIVSLSQGVVKGVSGGFGDIIRNLNSKTLTMSSIWDTMCNKMLDAFANFVENVISNQLSKLMASLTSSLSGSIGGFFGGGSSSSEATPNSSYSGWDASNWTASAHGNVFQTPSLSSYTNSIVSSPTFFPVSDNGLHRFATGGVMGEAGPEAIVPLRRLSGGDLGVKAQVGSGTNVVVNNYSNQPATTKENKNNKGGKTIEVLIGEAAASQIATYGTKLNRAVTKTFGAQQATTGR